MLPARRLNAAGRDERGTGSVRPITDAELLPAEYRQSITEPSSRSTRASASVSSPPLVPRSPATSWTAVNGRLSIGPARRVDPGLTNQDVVLIVTMVYDAAMTARDGAETADAVRRALELIDPRLVPRVRAVDSLDRSSV